MNIKQIRKFVEENSALVTRKESGNYPGLFVIKYKNKVFYDNLWTPELMETRGLIVDADWNVIVHPFTKIFNRFENGTDFNPDDMVIAVRKINGFMACVTWSHKNHCNIVSTTGSLDSPYVDMAIPYLQYLNINCQFTYIFEICDPSDPHIVEEKPGAYLIGMRDLDSGEMMGEAYLDGERIKLNRYIHNMNDHVLRPEWYQDFFKYICENVKNVHHEGFVVHNVDGRSLKVKSPYYLITKFLARKRTDRLEDLIDDPYKLKQTVDEEFYSLIDYIVANKIAFLSSDERGRIQTIEEFLGVT